MSNEEICGLDDLFEIEPEENDWEEEWKGMPEYDNVEQTEPEVTVLFRFRSWEAFEEFKEKIREHLFEGERPFDGMQKKGEYNTWYPHTDRPRKYRYVDES